MIGRSKPPNTLQAPAIPSPNRPHLSLRRILVNKRRRLVSTERRRELQVAWLFRNSPPPSSSDAKRSWSARRPIWSEGKRSCAMPERKHGATIGHRCRRNTVRLRVSIRTLTWKSRRSSRKSCANCTICGCVSCEDLFNKWIGTKVWNIIIYLHIQFMPWCWPSTFWVEWYWCSMREALRRSVCPSSMHLFSHQPRFSAGKSTIFCIFFVILSMMCLHTQFKSLPFFIVVE